MFTKAFLLGAIASLAAAQSSVLTFTHVPNPVTDGQAQAITYATNDTTSPVTITLRKGLSTDLQTIETLTTTATGGQYVWTPSLSLPNGVDYALQISQGSQINYFGPFVVQGASAYTSASGSASATGSSNVTTTTSTTVAPVGTNSAGTGTALPRNTTLSIASLSSATSTRPASNAASATSSAGAGFQSATGSASASQSASGASNIQIGSSIALFGAIAAAVFLQ